jgi:hypothetical protein
LVEHEWSDSDSLVRPGCRIVILHPGCLIEFLYIYIYIYAGKYGLCVIINSFILMVINT